MQKIDPGVRISIIIPVYNAASSLGACLAAVQGSSYSNYELLVVNDGSTDRSAEIAQLTSATVIDTSNGPVGPAAARNLGAVHARGEILFFVDADVLIATDTLGSVAEAFDQRPEYDALFGSYDDEPGDAGFLSQYKNLTHAYVHQQAQNEGSTFWSGCGAVRREVFLRHSGFDVVRYPRPSIEDIELGRRMKRSGSRIWVDKTIQVKHLKRWTFKGLLKTDIFDRGIPWTRLILSERNIPDDLNLNRGQRTSALLTALLVFWASINILHPGLLLLILWVLSFSLYINNWIWTARQARFQSQLAQIFIASLVLLGVGILTVIFKLWGLLPLIGLVLSLLFIANLGRRAEPSSQNRLLSMSAILFGFGLIYLLSVLPLVIALPVIFLSGTILFINLDLYRFLADRKGIVFAIAAFPLQLLYYCYSLASFGIGAFLHLRENLLRPRVEIGRHE
ncbi:MAG: glycosyltransferase [Anaerolineales bacterium]|jgi:glycosyltransferase involved in cell wall biosynthesis|nr:glycosyltransferase [Anaerolineales bacterium]